MSSPHAAAPDSTDPFSRLLELARLWSARPRWEELRFALHLAAGDTARLVKERGDMHDFIARDYPPETIQLQRQILQHEEQTSAGSSRQLNRWLTELCELHHLTQAHAPHLLGHVPDAHQFTGGADRPPPSDAACETYAGQVRTLLGHLIAEQRRPSGAAVVTSRGITDEGHTEGEKPATPDGPEGGRWVRWKGKRHEVPGGNVYNLIARFWSRDYVTYDDLGEHVFSDPVEPQTIRSNLSKTNKVLKKIGIPWRLTADSNARVARKTAGG